MERRNHRKNRESAPMGSQPNEAVRLALYSAVNEQMRSYRNHQWTLATLTITLLFGVGQFVEKKTSLTSGNCAKSAITVCLIMIAGLGTCHLIRLQIFLTTHKRVRNLLERSFGFKQWRELSDLFPLLGKKKVSMFGDWFELALWIIAFLLVGSSSSYIVWSS